MGWFTDRAWRRIGQHVIWIDCGMDGRKKTSYGGRIDSGGKKKFIYIYCKTYHFICLL